MELHFCNECGISIPQAEIDSGVAAAPGGRTLCAEHRRGSGGLAATATAVSADEPELLFCANCRVSIPVGDVQSGRARREYGSLLCGVCAKADPGERAARREAVEAEMAADVEGGEAVATRHCSTCAAVVPYSQIVTGKAKLDGDRVVCERCRASAPAASGGSRAGTVVLVILLIAACAAAGFLVTGMVTKQIDDQAAEHDRDLENLRSDLNKVQLAALARPDDGEQTDKLITAARDLSDRKIAALREEMRSETASLRADLNALRAEHVKESQEVATRIARIEGQLAGLSELVKGLASRPAEAPPRTTPEPPPGNGGAKQPEQNPNPPPVAPPDPEVLRNIKDLQESPDDGVRFAAAQELMKRKDPAAIPALTRALVEDSHFLVRRTCGRSLGLMRAWNAVPALIRALEDKESYVAQQANTALFNVTGQDFGVTQDSSPRDRKTKATAATKWWEKNKDTPPEGVSLHPATM